MKMTRFFLIALIVGFAAVAARADGVDPKITIGGGGSCDGHTLDSLTQSFSSLSTGCQIDFTNGIFDGEFPVTLFKVVVNVTSGFTGQLTCAALEGSIFSVDTESSTANACVYFTNNGDTGFQNGNTFSLQFDNDPSGVGGFTGACKVGDTTSLTCVDVTIAQTVINTPEPASAVLLLAGAGALAAFRKRRRTA